MMSVTSSRTPGERRELVRDALDLHRGDGGALETTRAAPGAAELPNVYPKPRSSGSIDETAAVVV